MRMEDVGVDGGLSLEREELGARELRLQFAIESLTLQDCLRNPANVMTNNILTLPSLFEVQPGLICQGPFLGGLRNKISGLPVRLP